MLVTLGNCEIDLGVLWLASLGPIMWDFEKLRMEFRKGGRRVVLRRKQKTNIEWMEGKRFQQAIPKAGQLFAIQIQPKHLDLELCSVDHTQAEMQELLTHFDDFFRSPGLYLLTESMTTRCF